MHTNIYDDKEPKNSSAGTGSSGNKNSRMLSNALLLLLLAVFLYSGYRLLGIAGGYLAGRKEYASTAETYVKKSDTAPAKTETDETVADVPETEEADSGEPPLLPPVEVDFDGLKAANPDVVGWIISDGTMINYPVLRAEDNDKYLHHTMNGAYNDGGSIFMDYRCRSDLSEPCTILYGHHMKDGSMFASLHNYTKSEYYEQHPYMWYLTPRGDYRLDLYAGYLEAPNAPIYSLLEDQEALDAYLQYADGKSNFTRKYDPESIEHIIVLSTCAYEFKNARYLVICVPVKVR